MPHARCAYRHGMDALTWAIAGYAVAVAAVVLVVVPVLRDRERRRATPGGTEDGQSPGGTGEASPVVVGHVPGEPLAFRPRTDLPTSLEAAMKSRIVVVQSAAGVQGVGKTHLAAAYARAQIASGWPLVAWVNAGDAAGVLAGLADVAARHDMGGYEGNAMEAGMAVRRWLEADGQRCLLVFDGATDPKLLQPFIPTAGKARVIIVSDQRSVANLGEAVPVDVFSGREALAFLAERTGLDDTEGAGALAARLGYLPLALAQAAAAIADQHLSYGSYLDRLLRVSVDMAVDRALRWVQAGRDPHQVAATVLLGLDGVRAGDDAGACAAIMELLAVLSADGVRRSVVCQAAQLGVLHQAGQAAELSSQVADRALVRLAGTSLLTFSADGSSVRTHPLVIRVIREQLAGRDSLAAVCAAAAQLLDRLAESYRQTWHTNRSAVRDLVQQIMALYESSARCPADSGLAHQMMRLRVLAAWFLGVLGDSEARSALLQEPLQAGQEKAPGVGHLDKAAMRENLDSALHLPAWMRRPRVSQPHLSLTRTYAAEFTAEALLELSTSQIHDIRAGVIARAANQLRSGNVTVKYDLTLDGNLTIEISATEYLPTVDRITDRILADVKRYADEAFRPLSENMVAAITQFLAADRAVKGRLGTYDESYFRFMRTSFFGMTPLRIVTSAVDFSVESRVAAAARDRRRLNLLAEGSVLDYFERNYRARPRPNQYTITQNKRSSLQVASDEEGVAEDVSAALLGESRGSRAARRSLDRWPPATTPYWGVGTLASAIFALAISAFGITPIWLAVTALGAAVTVGSALMMARRAGASMPKTALGMSPSVIVLAFAVYYGSLMLGSHPSVIVAATTAPHLVDAFLLSLGMASTGGFFDLALRATAVRVAAFAEMLLMVSVAGGSLYAGARAAWDRLSDVIRIGLPG